MVWRGLADKSCPKRPMHVASPDRVRIELRSSEMACAATMSTCPRWLDHTSVDTSSLPTPAMASPESAENESSTSSAPARRGTCTRQWQATWRSPGPPSRRPLHATRSADLTEKAALPQNDLVVDA